MRDIWKVITTCLPTWRTSCHHIASQLMWSWCKVSKCGYALRQHNSLTQAYKNLIRCYCQCLSSIIMFRSSLSIHIFFVGVEVLTVAVYGQHDAISQKMATYICFVYNIFFPSLLLLLKFMRSYFPDSPIWAYFYINWY
jgi:hypothetical protein